MVWLLLEEERIKLSLMDQERRLEGKDEIIMHIKKYLATLYSQEVMERPTLDNTEFSKLSTAEACG